VSKLIETILHSRVIIAPPCAKVLSIHIWVSVLNLTPLGYLLDVRRPSGEFQFTILFFMNQMGVSYARN
jgi:hypothetical protein